MSPTGSVRWGTTALKPKPSEKKDKAAAEKDSDDGIVSEKQQVEQYSESVEKYWEMTEPDVMELLRKKKEEMLKKPSLGARIGGVFKAVGRGFAKVGRGTWLVITEPSRIPILLKKLWKEIKEACHEYWHGFKLFCADVVTGTRLLRKITRGPLTRRERRQLVRTAADVFRIVPFAIIVIVPFLELALPVLLKLFPNMLPSHFQSQHKKQEDMKRQLLARLTMAEFLQDTVQSMARKKLVEGKKVKEAEDLLRILELVRQGRRVSNEDLVSVAKLFNDDITLDNMSRPQIISIAKFLGLRAYGSDSSLRHQLQQRIDQIREDDVEIDKEGLNNLNEEELKAACSERGMRASGLTKAGLRRNLQQWLDLSLHQKVPLTLLILSRAFTISERRPDQQLVATRELQETLLSFDQSIVDEVRVSAGVADSASKLELLKRQNEMIEAEQEEREMALAATREAYSIERKIAEEMSSLSAASSQEMLLNEKIPDITDDLSLLASPSSVSKEREKLAKLKKRVEEAGGVEAVEELERVEKELALRHVKQTHLKVDLDAASHLPEMKKQEEKAAAMAKEKEAQSEEEEEKDRRERKEKKRADKLAHRVLSMLTDLERQIEAVDKQIGSRLNLLDRDGDGKISTFELREAIKSNFKDFKTDDEVEFVVKRIKELCAPEGEFFVSLEDLEKVKDELAKKRLREEEAAKKDNQEEVAK